jgi:polyisoprenoid-binding protein YceI
MRQGFLLAVTAASLTWGTAQGAWAKDWTVDTGKSKIGFTGTQSGKAFEGSFKKFTAMIDFDPAHPETGHITADIDTGSAATGDTQRDETMPQTDWFNVKAFPIAHFASTKITAAGADRYTVVGTLTIKGVSHDVMMPMTLKQEGDHWHAAAHADLMRNDFKIGQNAWADETYVKYAVAVTVDIVATPK